jgi:hypothetical protein
VDLRRGRGRYVGYALLAGLGLWNLGFLSHAPRLHLSNGEPTWAELRDPHGRATPLETTLAEAASSVAGRAVSVRCDDLSDLHDDVEPGGVVQFSGETPANFTRIRFDMCGQLRRLTRDRGAGGALEARALEVLAHESFHLRGVKNEAAAQCYAVQFIGRVARSLGATPANAEMLHRLAVRAYPYHPPSYRSPECRPGGKLDLHGELPRELPPAA